MNTRNAIPGPRRRPGSSRPPSPRGLTSRQAGMKRSSGEGSPWDPACFQLESSPLARALSQAEGPGGRERLFTGWRGSKESERRAQAGRCQGHGPGDGGPARRAGASAEERARAQGQRPRREAAGSGGTWAVDFPGQKLGEAGLQNRRERLLKPWKRVKLHKAGVGEPRAPAPHCLSPPGN